jgi:hypothetical protein
MKVSQKLSRTAELAGLRKPAGRWAAWSRVLIARYLRIPHSQHAPILLLLRQRAAASFPVQRWHRHVWRLDPTIKLAIGPFLTHINRIFRPTERPRAATEQRRDEGHGEYRLAAPSREVLPSNRFRRAKAPRPAAAPLADQRDHSYRDVMPPRQADVRAAAVVHATVTHHLSETVVKKVTEQVLRRVVHARQRIEERPVGPSVVMKHRESMPMQPAAIAVDMQPTAPRMDSRAASEAERLTTTEIHRLSERVLRELDDRVRAYRERMGKSL